MWGKRYTLMGIPTSCEWTAPLVREDGFRSYVAMTTCEFGHKTEIQPAAAELDLIWCGRPQIFGHDDVLKRRAGVVELVE